MSARATAAVQRATALPTEWEQLGALIAQLVAFATTRAHKGAVPVADVEMLIRAAVSSGIQFEGESCRMLAERAAERAALSKRHESSDALDGLAAVFAERIAARTPEPRPVTPRGVVD